MFLYLLFLVPWGRIPMLFSQYFHTFIHGFYSYSLSCLLDQRKFLRHDSSKLYWIISLLFLYCALQKFLKFYP